MRKSRFTEAQIVGILKELDAGTAATELARRHGSDVEGVGDFFILGFTLIAPNQCKGSCTGNVLFYNYPGGGLPTKTITKGVRYPHGLVVSKAPP